MTDPMKTLSNRPAAHFAIALMLGCMGFYLWDVSVDVFDHITTGTPFTHKNLIHTGVEIVAVAGLGYGLYSTWMFQRLLAQHANGQAQTISLLRGSFDTVLKRKFDDWGLTPAERDVTIYILKGLAGADIATARNVSLGTTKNQITAIFRKIGVGSRTELMSLFMDEFLDEASTDTPPAQK